MRSFWRWYLWQDLIATIWFWYEKTWHIWVPTVGSNAHKSFTSLQANISHENWWLEDDISFWNCPFLGDMFIFLGVIQNISFQQLRQEETITVLSTFWNGCNHFDDANLHYIERQQLMIWCVQTHTYINIYMYLDIYTLNICAETYIHIYLVGPAQNTGSLGFCAVHRARVCAHIFKFSSQGTLWAT